MKALVTGANGFSGSHLVRALLERGHDVVGLVRTSSNCERLQTLPLTLAYGDICDSDALARAMEGVDVIFHLAAMVDLGVVNDVEMERVNVQGTRTVIEAAIARPTPPKLVYCSTIGVLGDTAGTVVDETHVRQQQEFSSAYDRTKYDAQALVDAAARGLWVASALPSGIFGADDPHFGPVLKLFLSGRLKLWPGGDRITGIVHVDDLADALIRIAEQGRSGERYILSAGERSLREMFELMSKNTDIPAPAEAPRWLMRVLGHLLTPMGRLLNWNPPISRERVHYIYDRCVRVDGTKARRELGWQPRSIESTLSEIVRQLQAATG
ncbi:MAG: NAD-dependent epimerase/dehydratase family protein [Cyanobacteria bacterium P01_E01_bin.45]